MFWASSASTDFRRSNDENKTGGYKPYPPVRRLYHHERSSITKIRGQIFPGHYYIFPADSAYFTHFRHILLQIHNMLAGKTWQPVNNHPQTRPLAFLPLIANDYLNSMFGHYMPPSVF